jgi:glycine cleavage system H protein
MLSIAGYELDSGRRYDPDTNLWVAQARGGRMQVGLDPLGAETMGDIVAISFAEVGTRVARGEPLATIEAAKFVGPVAAPLSGVLAAVNEAVALEPGVVNGDPLGSWLVELAEVADGQLDRLVSGEASIRAWFEDAVEKFRRMGALAE